MARLNLKTVLKDKFRIQARFFYESFFRALSVSQRELDRRFQQAGNNPEYVGFLEEEAADLNAFIGEGSHLLFVALHHWVERELKGILAHCVPSAARKILNWDGIRLALTAHGVRLEEMPSFGDIDVLRHFSNSWKHDPWWASEKLLRALDLDPKARLRLSDFAVETALRRRVTLSEISEERDVIFAFRDRALAFLCAVADVAPIEFRRRPSPGFTRVEPTDSN